MSTLDAVLHDALAQSERFHGGLHAPAVRSTIARKRVIRRAAVSSAATVGAVGIGAGTYAIATVPAPHDVAAVGSSVSGSPSIAPATSAAPVTKDAISPSASPKPSASTAAAPLYVSGTEFCQHLPLIIAWSEAAGTSIDEVHGTHNMQGDPSVVGCDMPEGELSDPYGFQVLMFHLDTTPGGDVAKLSCADDRGTATLDPETTRETPTEHTRTAVACFGGVLVVMAETIDSPNGFALSDDDFLAAATTTAVMADEARKYAK